MEITKAIQCSIQTLKTIYLPKVKVGRGSVKRGTIGVVCFESFCRLPVRHTPYWNSTREETVVWRPPRCNHITTKLDLRRKTVITLFDFLNYTETYRLECMHSATLHILNCNFSKASLCFVLRPDSTNMSVKTFMCYVG